MSSGGTRQRTPPLACTVRDCGLLLEPEGNAFRCARRHTYDIARSGYINLLQPTDRRSSAAGDRFEAVDARARLLAQGIGTALIDHLVALITAHAHPHAVVTDLGSGSGELLARLQARAHESTCVGVDISTVAADYAARRHPGVTWVVANADRGVPLLDRSVDVVVSVHGRRNPDESARVLTRNGLLLVAVPAMDDLGELRYALHGEARERERGATVERAHDAHFVVVDRTEVRERHALDQHGLRDLLTGTYRGVRRSEASRLDAIGELDVTLASSVFLLRRREA